MDARLDASRLESLLESAKILGSSLHLDDQISHLLRTLMGRLLVTRAVVALNKDQGLQVAIARGVAALKKDAPFDPDIAAANNLPHIFPIEQSGEKLGVIALGKTARGSLDEAEREFLNALVTIAAAAIANARSHESVIRSNQELRALLDLVQGFTSTTEPDEVAQLLTLTLAGRYAARKHALFTWKPNQPPIHRSKGMDSLDPQSAQSKYESLAGPLAEDSHAIFPLRSGETTSGVVILGPRPLGLTYSANDLDFGAGLAAQASVALDNAWHFRDTLFRRQIEKELDLAASIQKDLFPKSMPDLPHSALAASNRQARQVGGDYYDALPFGSSGKYLLTVVDISGKGIGASLLMASIQATLRALLSVETTLVEVAAKTSDLLYRTTPPSKYATAIMVLYDPNTGNCEYVNGGHNEGVVLRANGEIELLRATGVPMGLLPARTYDSTPFTLNAGDILLIYSDGAVDACTEANDEFELDRLTATLTAARHDSPEAILNRTLAAIDEFVAGAPQFDDITMMVLKRQA